MRKNIFIILITVLVPIKSFGMFTLATVRRPSPITTCAHNTCYINSAIQAFYAITPLRSLILDNENPFFDFNDAPPADQLPFLFVETVKALANNNNAMIVGRFQKQAGTLLNDLAGGGVEEQQDISELILPFTGSFRNQAELLAPNNPIKMPLLKFFPSLIEDRTTVYQYTIDFADTDRIEEEHPNSLMFSLGIDEDLKSIPTDKPILSEKKIREFLNPITNDYDIMVGNNLIKKRTIRISRYFKQPPVFIIFHIKRWIFDPETQISRKDTRLVSIPERLKLNFIVKPNPDHNLHYNLKAAIHHAGGVGSGHYVTYANYNDKWWYCSDSTIEERGSINKIKNEIEASYIFIYELTPKNPQPSTSEPEERSEPIIEPTPQTKNFENTLRQLIKTLETLKKLIR